MLWRTARRSADPPTFRHAPRHRPGRGRRTTPGDGSRSSRWSLRWAELPQGVMGLTCHWTRTVTLALGISQAERRCTIAHETEHIVRGPVPPHDQR